MPLRDHFHAPLDDVSSWEGFHGQWPAMLVQALSRKLPPDYVAAPRVHLGAFVEIDVATYGHGQEGSLSALPGNRSGGPATAVWAPARPTSTVETDLPTADEYEVRVYDTQRGRRLVSAIEIVSPANKDRPEHRRAFVAKCAALLQNQVSVVIVDLVTTRDFNLYYDLLELIGQPELVREPPPIYAVSCRATKKDRTWLLEGWEQPLSLGQPLPTLPLWLADNLAIPLELEASYEETYRVLRLP
jgi:hypothetical protein